MDFLTKIQIPDLRDPQFQSQFNDFCIAIRDNFEKLISVQYTRGEKGTSIITQNVSFVEYVPANDGSNQRWRGLTSLGASYLNAVFHTDRFSKGMYLTDTNINAMDIVNDIAPILRNRSAIDVESFCNTSIPVFIDPDGGYAYIGSPYMFIDNRIADLADYLNEGHQEYDEEIDDLVATFVPDDETNRYRNFQDFSCSFVGNATYRQDGNPPEGVSPTQYQNWFWSCTPNDIVPKLYFDDNVKEFCWQVNGQKTAVTAQGLKGDNGSSTAVHICKTTVSGNYLRIDSAEYIDRTSGNPARVWHTSAQALDESEDYNAYDAIKDKDLVLAYYTDGGRWKAFLGQAVVVSDTEKKVYFGATPESGDARIDLFYSIMNQTVGDMMGAIGYRGDNNEEFGNGGSENGNRGIWLHEIDTNNNSTTDIFHMIYVDWLNPEGADPSPRHVLRISPVNRNSINGDVAAPQIHDRYADENAKMEVDYDVKTKDAQVDNLQVNNNMSVQGTTNINGNVNIQGAMSVQGPTVLQDLIVQGTLQQNGTINSDLKIAGTRLVSNIIGQNASSDSRFTKAVVSEVTNVKTFVTGTRIKDSFTGVTAKVPTFGGHELADNTHAYYDPIALLNRLQDTNAPTHKMYVGITFNLRLIVGYMGYGYKMARNGIYSRMGLSYSRRDKKNISNNERDYSNLYNACEYNIPVYAYREVLIGWNPGQGTMGAEGYVWPHHAILTADGELVDRMYFEFRCETNPIVYDGQIINPVINFNTVVSVDKPANWVQEVFRGRWDSNGKMVARWSADTTPAPQEGNTKIAKSIFNITFYQGSVEASANLAFGLLESSRISSDIINKSMVSGLYKKNTANEVELFAPLWPYQICEQALENESPDWMITNQRIGGKIGLWNHNGITPAEMKEKYSQYVMECALPRMCVLADGSLTFKSTRTKGANNKDTVEHTVEYSETPTKPQMYLSFFNNGRVNSMGIPYYDECSININRIFRIDNIDILDTNINTHYYRINNDDGIEEDMNTQIDADQETIGLDSEEDDYNTNTSQDNSNLRLTVAEQTYSMYVRRSSTNTFTRADNTIHILGHSLLRHTDSAAESSNTHSWITGGGTVVAPIVNGGDDVIEVQQMAPTDSPVGKNTDPLWEM